MFLLMCICLLISMHATQINSQDPWNYDNSPPAISDGFDIPPDIRMPLKKKVPTETKLGLGEWFFRRILAVFLKGGETQLNEDGSVDISLQMKFEPKEWETLEDCLKSENPLSEDMLRKTMGYVQDSIYKPTITEKIVMAWSDYVHTYLTEYKTYITWTLCFLAASGGLLWLWSNMSNKHVIYILLIIFYAYEVIISYKEAEQIELNKFLTAVNQCQWFFWKSTCEVPPPDPLIFMKHMNPLKIGMRMVTTAVAEPIVAFIEPIQVILEGVTDCLWFPFNKLAYILLAAGVTISLIFLVIMIIFNWLLNIPFNFGFGLINLNIPQRNRSMFSNQTQEAPRAHDIQDNDRISEATFHKVLDTLSLAISNNTQSRAGPDPVLPSARTLKAANLLSSKTTSKASMPSIRRSASTGRLPNFESFGNEALEDVPRRRNRPCDGSGDTL